MIVLSACGGATGITVTRIEVMDYGVLGYGQAAIGKDGTSSIGAAIARARSIKVVNTTSKIPLRIGLAYGIAFVVRGQPADAVVPITVVLRSSRPCVLKSNGATVFTNDSVLQVKVGELRHIGGRFVTADENHCQGPSTPGDSTFELYYENKKLAERTFHIVDD
jgi:hypothetical protein